MSSRTLNVNDATVSTNISETTPLITATHTSKHRVTKNRNSDYALLLEPVAIFFFFGFALQSGFLPLYTYYRETVRLNVTDDSSQETHQCHPVGPNSTADDAYMALLKTAQKRSSEWIILFAIATTAPVLVTVPLIGSWSDKQGRRVPLLYCILIEVIRSISTCLFIMYNMSLWAFFAINILSGVSGSAYAVMAICLGCVSDKCKSRIRSCRISIFFCLFGITSIIANLAMGWAIHLFGFTITYAIATASIVIAFIHAAICTSNLLDRSDQQEDISNLTDANSSLSATLLSTVKSSAEIFLSRGCPKPYLVLPLLSNVLFFIHALSINSIETLYFMYRPFCWSTVEVGYFGAFQWFVVELGLLSSMIIFRKNMHPGMFALIGLASSAASKLLEGFALNSPMLYAAGSLGLFTGLPGPMIRSFMSLRAPKRSQGLMFAIVSTIDCVCGVVGSVVFNLIYEATLSHIKGFVFYICAGCSTTAFLTMALASWFGRKRRLQAQLTIIN